MLIFNLRLCMLRSTDLVFSYISNFSPLPHSLSFLMMIFKCVLFVCMCSVGLANPGEAFTVFYGERNPWCEYKIHTMQDIQTSDQIQGLSDFILVLL